MTNGSDKRGSSVDYGEGKTYEQEAHDSMVMLAVVMVASAVALIVAGLTIAAVWIIF